MHPPRRPRPNAGAEDTPPTDLQRRRSRAVIKSLLNDIKLKIHIGHLTLATDFADFNIWLISNFGRFTSRELHFNEKSTF